MAVRKDRLITLQFPLPPLHFSYHYARTNRQMQLYFPGQQFCSTRGNYSSHSKGFVLSLTGTQCVCFSLCPLCHLLILVFQKETIMNSVQLRSCPNVCIRGPDSLPNYLWRKCLIKLAIRWAGSLMLNMTIVHQQKKIFSAFSINPHRFLAYRHYIVNVQKSHQRSNKTHRHMMVLFILPVKFLILFFISTTLELQEILLQGQCCCFLCPVLEDEFSFEIWEDDREIVVDLCKIFASSSNLIPNKLHIRHKAGEEKNK